MTDGNAYETSEFAEVYDAVYAGRGDHGFWLALAAESGGGPLLELACGTGRILVPLARAGYEVAGLDLSAQMLARARVKAAAEPPEVRARISLHSGDMTSFDLDRRFALVTSPFGGFHHLRTVEQQLACLERCRRHLLPGGRLALDLLNPDPVPASRMSEDEPDGEETATVVEWIGGRRIRSWMTVVGYDRAQQCNECEMTYEITAADGGVTRVVQAFPLRYLFRFELEHLLARAGFETVALYGDYDRSPFGERSPGLIAVARRAGG